MAKKNKQPENTIDLPEVKDIPGQEHVTPRERDMLSHLDSRRADRDEDSLAARDSQLDDRDDDGDELNETGGRYDLSGEDLDEPDLDERDSEDED